jgi:SAM-dependent methyltransferase
MIAPLDPHDVLGLDFNQQACADASANGVPIVRGDAFSLPLADQTIGQVINCQFLNQQTSEQTHLFVAEVARVLKPGGRLILTWRHAQSLMHRGASLLFEFIDSLRGGERFPQFTHPMVELESMCTAVGLRVCTKAVTPPIGFLPSLAPGNPISLLAGASLHMVADKP